LRELIFEEERFDIIDRTRYDIFVGTTEEFQGSERNIMILTIAHDGISRGGNFWEDRGRLNVATSRAINYTYFVYGGMPPNAKTLKAYLNHFGIELDATTNGDANAPSESTVRRYEWVFNRARYDSAKLESEFEGRVSEFLQEYCNSRRDQYVIELYNQVAAGSNIDSCGQKRLDFVLYCESTRCCVAVEVDGQHHFDQNSGKTYGEAHLERVAILKRAGWNIVHIPYYEWYDRGWLCDRESDPKFQRSWNRTKQQLDHALDLRIVT
jgi:hypothetical protein